jgi:hypothetical protein
MTLQTSAAHPTAHPWGWQIHQLRGCQLCDYRGPAPGPLACTHPRVAVGVASVPCLQARDDDSLCGPNARHHHWAAVDGPLPAR